MFLGHCPSEFGIFNNAVCLHVSVNKDFCKWEQLWANCIINISCYC